jgi:hypothetical protein
MKHNGYPSRRSLRFFRALRRMLARRRVAMQETERRARQRRGILEIMRISEELGLYTELQ